MSTDLDWYRKFMVLLETVPDSVSVVEFRQIVEKEIGPRPVNIREVTDA
jgi:hypothetical protein